MSSQRKVILFGSYVRSTETRPSNDLDILVVTRDENVNARQESVRIRRALRGIAMPIDILVVSENNLDEVGDHPGLVYRELLQYGKVAYESNQ